jgi:multisubunit Na+/H+ antiporter MnhG subunit
MSQQDRSLISLPNGAAAAAMLAAAFGAFALGVIVLLGELGVFTAPSLYAPAGGVSGRTTIAVVIWLLAWAGLHRRWRDQDVNMRMIAVAAVVLILVGVAGTFPPVWDLLGA